MKKDAGNACPAFHYVQSDITSGALKKLLKYP